MRNRLKIAVIGFFLFLLFGSLAYSEEIKVESSISAVTIYPGYALISRTAKVGLNPGSHQVIFPDIIPEVNDDSVRVSAKGTAQAKLFGAQVKREYLQDSPSEKIKQLQAEIQDLEDQTKKLDDFKSLSLEEKDFLDSIRLFSKGELPKDMVTKVPQAAELDNVLKFLDVKLKENYEQRSDADFKIRGLAKKLDALRNELAQISQPAQKLKRSIIVELEVSRPGDLTLDVSYLVAGAYWQPIYDARADFDKSEVELVSYGLVKQTTGEDWQGVEIALSTAKPTVGGSMPYVAPWFLKPYEYRTGESGMLRLSKNVLAGASAPAAQFQALDLAEPEKDKQEQKAQVAYSEAQEKGTAVVYKLARKETLKSDGAEHKLPISSQNLKANFEYSSYPRLSPFAYLGSRVTNAEGLQLLPGQVNIFLNGDFVGSSNIGNISPGEEFDLYLGIDENVKVKREQIVKKVDDIWIAGIPAPNRKTTFKYKLSMENYKNKKVRAVLFEAMPVSQDERIKAKLGDVSLAPKEKDWKDRKGIWRWELELEPKARQEIFYSYTVEHPRDMIVEGL